MNTAGMRGRQRRRQILNNMWNSDNDIIFLQAKHISSDIYKETEKLWPGTILFSPGKENTGGTAISFRDKNMTANNIITDKSGNYQILDVELNGHKITLTNTSTPHQEVNKNTKRQKKSMNDPTKHTKRQINTGQHTHTRRRLQHDGRQSR